MWTTKTDKLDDLNVLDAHGVLSRNVRLSVLYSSKTQCTQYWVLLDTSFVFSSVSVFIALKGHSF